MAKLIKSKPKSAKPPAPQKPRVAKSDGHSKPTKAAKGKSTVPSDLKAQVKQIIRGLAKAYPDATCALMHESAYQLLVATILSAQCTDERVNMVTPALFAKYPEVESLAQANQSDVEEIIRSTGFFVPKPIAFAAWPKGSSSGSAARSPSRSTIW